VNSKAAAEMGGRTSAPDASGRPLSDSPDAVRKRESRQASKKTSSSSVGGRGGAESSKGNPLRPDDPFAKAGEPLGEREATDQLFYAHVGLAKVLRSDIDLHELDEEFEVAGKNYAYVANHLWTPLRVVIRFVAPLVLFAALVMIWGAIIAETSWIHGIRNWWSRRGEEQGEQTPPPPAPATANQAQPRPADVQQEPEQPRPSPPIPRRPAVIRSLRGVHR